MSYRIASTILTLAAITAAGAGGYYAGQDGLRWPGVAISAAEATQAPAAASGPVIYYRDPDGKPAYSAGPRKTADGRDYVPVHAGEDIGFDEASGEVVSPAAHREGGEPGEAKRILYYRNPMGLPDTSPVPKKDSMGMDYIPVYEGDDDDGDTVKVSAGKLQRTGVRTEPAQSRVLSLPVRASGTIQLDERRIAVVATRSDAFIDHVEDVTTGDRVSKGQPLLRLYSPDIAAAAAQYLSSLGAQGARQRLENLNVPAEVIDEIERSHKVATSITWTAPRDGIVIERNVVDGMKAAPGDVLFRLADISTVWALVDVTERDLPLIAVGQTVTVRARGFVDRSFTGKVAVIYPQVNKETRTTRVRVELANPDGVLRPDMYVDAEIATGGQTPVTAVPTSAVIDSGTRQVVIVDKGEGRFEPRPVKLGRRNADYVEIREGVSPGDTVVVAANFLIDAESNLKAALQGLADGRRQQMIARLITWSARNIMLVLIASLFAVAAGVYALTHLPLDAIPDLSDTQVIVYTEDPGQAPQVVEDQVTYPLTTAMLTVPKSKVVRGFSFFGVSFVYIIFEDGTDIYWARSRVLEYLNAAATRLPAGVTPTLGPDATGVGWVYQYAVDRQGPDPGGDAQHAGLGAALRSRQGRRRGRDRQRRRLRQAVQRGGRSAAPARSRHHARQGPRGHPRQQHRCGRPHRRTLRFRVHGARQGLSARHRRSRQDRAEGRQRHAGAAQGCGPDRTRAGRAARHHRAQWGRRGRERHRPAALRLECARRHRQRQGAYRRADAEPAGGHQDRAGL